MHGTCGGSNRRGFLRATAATGAAAAATPALLAQEAKAPAVPLVTLGRTGQKVTKLGMGTSWALSPSFVQASLAAGVRFIDTSESYENGQSERVLGQVLARTGLRKDVYLVSKNSRGKVAGPGALKTFEERLNGSLERLATDYIDCYYLHGVEGSEIGLLRDPDVKAVFEKLKKSGKIRFSGLSCHDALLPEIVDAAVEAGWVDQIMLKYNFRDVGGKDRSSELNRAIDKASKANIGLVAMKTQDGAASFPDKMADFLTKGFKKEVAAIKTVWTDDRMQVVVSEMTNRDQLRENVTASREELTPKEARLLEEHRQRTAHLYCHGCGHLCETAARGVPVSTVLRYLRYYSVYGKRQQARALYQALPDSARELAIVDLEAAEKACPHGLPVVSLMNQAGRDLA